MSINPETDLDLEKLFLPAWAQESAEKTNRFANFTGDEEISRDRRGDRRGPRPPRREGGGGGGERRGPAGQGRRFDGPHGPRRDDRHGKGPGFRGDFRREPRPEPIPLPEITAAVLPDEKGVESMARQVKMTGRAIPLFDIAFLVIQKPERYSVRFSVKKNAQGQPIQPLFHCALDETIWLSEEEAVAHVLQKHFATFYQSEKIQTEAPKGVYTFVGQCGLSGEILGPPNYHDYQTKLRKLHAERFSRMPFEAFKARVRIVRDEAVVKQWIEDQSWKTEYICLNVPEPLKLTTREEVEKHFVTTHKDAILKQVESQVISGMAARSLRGGLGRVVQHLLADQRRFPMQVATALSQAFAHFGLQFFKVNKTVTHVAVARPRFLDLETTPVSDGVKRIVDFINANPKCNRRKLLDALAPAPAPPAPAVSPSVPEMSAAAETTAAAESAPVSAPAAEPTPEQTVFIADLHWLIHQGHVIEFASGILETAKKPVPKPPKPEPKVEPKVEEKTEVQAADIPVAESATTESAQVHSTPAPEANLAEAASSVAAADSTEEKKAESASAAADVTPATVSEPASESGEPASNLPAQN